MFQFHPHPDLERRVLEEDRRRHAFLQASSTLPDDSGLEGDSLRRVRDCWKHADRIFCATSFSKRSLLEAGASEHSIVTIPYGIESTPAPGEGGPDPNVFRVIFVGSGVQRKGLHHLLLAWARARLPKASLLSLVCRVITPELRAMALDTPRVELLPAVSSERLKALYGSSHLFAMPSLVEGFGQVYLEALACGCPVLGTANTCLPDLGGEGDGIFLVSPGSVDELAAKLKELSSCCCGNQSIREQARSCAARFTWEAFRKRIGEQVNS